MASLITTEISQAAKVIAVGNLVAIPTETVYGLAADANKKSAIAQVYQAKGRPSDHPLIVHVASSQDAKSWYTQLPNWAWQLADKYWPGPLTIVGPKADFVLDEVTGGQDTVAVRVPSHPVAHKLLVELKDQGVNGLVAPSANKFGHVSPTSAKHVETDLAEYLSAHGGLILDGGSSDVGLESTIVLATGDQPVILRPGAITESDIESATGLKVLASKLNAPRVSGSLDSHYAPKTKVVLVTAAELKPQSDAGFIGLAKDALESGLVNLLAAQTPEEYATHLYEALRKGDELGLSIIYAVIPTGLGIDQAIADRLTRAAH